MRNIESKEDHLAVVAKYAEKLRLAQAKYIDLKHELVALERAMDAKPPAAASADEIQAYKGLQKRAQYSLKLAASFVSEYDELFAMAAKTVKLGR
ncbi:hypothetical protein [Roseateles toxinivorans]|uniref:Uncharacterized protein n=1 Tax=Roseateles toxinivorans TaxID=270368 RepID=A0A4R6QM50_9BURK|nr:hypothetical protein [Roseateles toxinivorans]TDP64322.1 hypothetical protein DES47_104612 [Roseateles toxinivorans]